MKAFVILSLAVVAVSAFPQNPPPQGQDPGPGCVPPPPKELPPNAPPPPPPGPDGKPLPECPATLIFGHCGGKTYWWDTAKAEGEPAAFKTCFYGDGPVGAVCNGKEYSWDPAKEQKPAELEACERTFLG